MEKENKTTEHRLAISCSLKQLTNPHLKLQDLPRLSLTPLSSEGGDVSLVMDWWRIRMSLSSSPPVVSSSSSKEKSMTDRFSLEPDHGAFIHGQTQR